MKKLIYVILALTIASTAFGGIAYAENTVFQNAKFQEAYSKIDWDGEYDDDTILVGVNSSDEALTIDNFPILDLTEIEEIYSKSGSKIYEFTLKEAGRERIKETIDIIGENYPIIDYAEPNYFFELCVWEPVEDVISPEDLDYETEVLPFLGDLDLDKELTILDAILYTQYFTGHFELTEMQKLFADANKDDNVNILDAIWIAQKIVE